MFVDEVMARRMAGQNRAYFAGLAPAAVRAGIDEPYLDLGTSIAFYSGDGSPLTQASGALEVEHLIEISRFYKGRSSSWEAVLTPFNGSETLQRVLDLGARVMGWESSLFRATAEPLPDWEAAPEIRIDEIDEDSVDVWSEIATKGFFGGSPSEGALMLEKIMQGAESNRRYLAYWDGDPAGAATLTFGSGVGFLGGMATMPEFRGRGIQMALLRRRIADCAGEADLATMGATPGSASHRNGERAGFRIAYSQLSLRVPV